MKKLIESYNRLSLINKVMVWLTVVGTITAFIWTGTWLTINGDLIMGDKVRGDKIVQGDEVHGDKNIYFDPVSSFDFRYDTDVARFLVGTKSPSTVLNKVEWYLPGAISPAANPIYVTNSKSISHRELVSGISRAALPFLSGFPIKHISQNDIITSIACHTHWLSDSSNDRKGIPIGINIQYSFNENPQEIYYTAFIFGLQPPILGRDVYPEIRELKKVSDQDEWASFLSNNIWLKGVALKVEERSGGAGNTFTRLDESFQCVR